MIPSLVCEVPLVEPHAEHNAEWPTGEEPDDVPSLRSRRELEQHEVRSADAQAVDEGSNVVASIHQLALQPESEDEQERAAEERIGGHFSPLRTLNMTSSILLRMASASSLAYKALTALLGEPNTV